MSKLRIEDDPQTLMSFERTPLNTEPRADRGPQAGSLLGVVDATGSYTQLTIGRGSIGAEWQHPVATARGSVLKR